MMRIEQIRDMIQEYGIETPEDIMTALKDMFGVTLTEMLNAEMSTELGYEKSGVPPKGSTNRRNGSHKKTVCSAELGEVDIAIPRDREGQFEPQIVKKGQKSVAAPASSAIRISRPSLLPLNLLQGSDRGSRPAGIGQFRLMPSWTIILR